MLFPNKATDSPVLLVVDVQEGFNQPDWGARSTPNAEVHIGRLLRRWRANDWPVVYAQHLSTSPTSPLRPGQPGAAIKAEVQPQEGEPVIQKRVNSAFIGTDLDARLRERGATTLVVVGYTTNHCVSTTARMAENLGYRVIVVADATVTHEHTDHRGRHFAAEVLQQAALANLHAEFATIADTDAILQEATRREA
mgnify:CR=1 FL=1